MKHLDKLLETTAGRGKEAGRREGESEALITLASILMACSLIGKVKIVNVFNIEYNPTG